MMNRKEIGSMTAKGGFLNESDICKKFLNYKNDREAQKWLKTMGYIPEKIQELSAIQIPVRINFQRVLELGVSEDKLQETIKYKKADIQIRIEIMIDHILHLENLSLKKANKSAGFNQVDKRPVLTYQQIWNFDDEICKWLRLFTGDILAENILPQNLLVKRRDQRRMFLDEVPTLALEKIIHFFFENKVLVISDILRGRGGLSAEWFLVTCKESETSLNWVLRDINTVINFYSKGPVIMTPKGSLKIGRVTMQRKGGTPDPTSLQFKINPLELLNEEKKQN